MENNSYYERAADGNSYFRVMRSHNNSIAAHFHNTTELIIVLDGTERVVINGVEHILHAGDIGVSNSFDIHYYEAVDTSEVYVVMLSDAYIRHFREAFGTRLGNFLPNNKNTQEIIRLVARLFAAQYDGNPLVLTGYIDVLLGTLHDAYPSEPSRDGDGGKVVEVLRYIEDHYAARLTLKSVAHKFGYSETYFSALFNRFVGMHFKDYLNRLRVSRAAVQLKSGDRKVSDVALSCGFESLNTYYRALKKWRPKV